MEQIHAALPAGFPLRFQASSHLGSRTLRPNTLVIRVFIEEGLLLILQKELPGYKAPPSPQVACRTSRS